MAVPPRRRSPRGARSAHSMAPALSPARKASRPISWNRCARSIGSPSSPSRSRPGAKQAPARSRSPASQCRPPILRCRRAPRRAIARRLELLPRPPRTAPSASAPPPVSPSRSAEPLARRPAPRARRSARAARRGCEARARSGGSRPRWRRRRAPSRRRPAGSARRAACRREAPVVAERLQVAEPLAGAGRRRRSSARPARWCSSVRRASSRFW